MMNGSNGLDARNQDSHDSADDLVQLTDAVLLTSSALADLVVTSAPSDGARDAVMARLGELTFRRDQLRRATEHACQLRGALEDEVQRRDSDAAAASADAAAQIADLRDSLDELRHKLSVADGAAEQLRIARRADRAEFDARAAALRDAAAQARLNLEAAKRAHEDASVDLKAENAALKARLAELRTAREGERRGWADEARALEGRCEALALDKAALEAVAAELRAGRDDEHARAASAEQALAAERSEWRGVQAALESRLQRATAQNDALVAERRKMRAAHRAWLFDVFKAFAKVKNVELWHGREMEPLPARHLLHEGCAELWAVLRADVPHLVPPKR